MRYFFIARGSAKPSAFGFPAHLPIVHKNRKQKKWNPRHSKTSNHQMPNGTTTAVQLRFTTSPIPLSNIVR